MKLSYILPTYHVEDYIQECIESLYKQNLCEADFEIIVIIDGSTDNCLRIVRTLQQQHNNIVILEQENQGVSIARNNGLRIAKGDFVAFVDPDDAIVSNSMSPILQKLEATQADIFVGEVKGINIEEWNETYPDLCRNNSRKSLSAKQMSGFEYFTTVFNIRKGYCFIYISRREYLLKQNIEFPANIVFTEDTWFSFNLVLHAKSIIYSDFVFYAYRNYHGSAVSFMNCKKIYSMFWVSEHIYKTQISNALNNNIQKKIREDSFIIFNLSIWYLAHYESVYKDRNLLLKKLSFKPIYANSINQLIFSLWFCLAPNSLIYMKHKLSKKTYKKWW